MDDDPTATTESSIDPDSPESVRTDGPRIDRHDDVARQEPDGSDSTDFERFVSYEDGADTVICDRHNPAAWVQSDQLVDLRQ